VADFYTDETERSSDCQGADRTLSRHREIDADDPEADITFGDRGVSFRGKTGPRLSRNRRRRDAFSGLEIEAPSTIVY
jgi:hypothetical protein